MGIIQYKRAMGDSAGERVASDPPFGDESGPTSRGQRRQQPRLINANHLLNFQSGGPPNSRDSRRSEGPTRRRPAPRSCRPQAYDRTKFLQANFRFMVSDAADIQKYEADPDLMLDWEDIASVDFVSTSQVICPITLGPPLCPCITPCGHIFSAEAIMAHMVTQGGPELRVSSACPVCTTKIAARELRPVAVRQVAEIKVGDAITLKVLRKRKNSIIPHPVGEEKRKEESKRKGTSSGLSSGVFTGKPAAPSGVGVYSTSGSSFSRWNAARADVSTEPDSQGDGFICNPYAKFTAVSDPMPIWASHAGILARKAAQLISEGGLDADYEVPHVLAAIDSLAASAKAWTERRQRLLLERLEMVQGESSSSGIAPEEAGRAAMAAVKRAADVAAGEEEKRHQKTAAAQALEQAFPALGLGSSPPARQHQQRQHNSAVSAAEEEISINGSSSSRYAQPSGAVGAAGQSGVVSSSTKDVDAIYLYQAADGQPLFLCPLNLKMLVDWAGSYSALPHEITARVLELEGVEQNEASRKRLKGVTHLPLGASYRICEIDLSEVLPPEALAPFEAELVQRAKRRVQQARQEARRSQRDAAKAASAASAAAAASAGPSAAELAAMPRLGAASQRAITDPMPVPLAPPPSFPVDDLTNEELAFIDEGASPSSSLQDGASGVSFARIARMGFAATGPALGEGAFPSGLGTGSSPPPVWGQAPSQHQSQSPGTSTGGVWGAWGSSSGPAPSNSSGVTGTSPGVRTSGWLAASTGQGSTGGGSGDGGVVAVGGKKKGKQKMLLLSTAQRRY